MQNEIWLGIEGHTGYEVSNSGKVRSLDRTVEASSKKTDGAKGVYTRVQHWKGKELSLTRLDSYGYPQVQLTNRKNFLVHRLVAEAFIIKEVGKNEINHKDGNKQNNNVDNLEWCNRLFNVRHAVANGLDNPPLGERASLAKFTDEEMRNLKPLLLASTASHASWARTLNISETTVAAIRKGRTWKHI